MRTMLITQGGEPKHLSQLLLIKIWELNQWQTSLHHNCQASCGFRKCCCQLFSLTATCFQLFAFWVLPSKSSGVWKFGVWEKRQSRSLQGGIVRSNIVSAIPWSPNPGLLFVDLTVRRLGACQTPSIGIEPFVCIAVAAHAPWISRNRSTHGPCSILAFPSRVIHQSVL